MPAAQTASSTPDAWIGNTRLPWLSATIGSNKMKYSGWNPLVGANPSNVRPRPPTVLAAMRR